MAESNSAVKDEVGAFEFSIMKLSLHTLNDMRRHFVLLENDEMKNDSTLVPALCA